MSSGPLYVQAFTGFPGTIRVDAGVLFGRGLLNRAARRFLRVFRRSRFDHQLDARLGSIPLATNTMYVAGAQIILDR